MADKIMCVYKITNTVNGKFYIGSTNDFTRRKREHYGRLEKQKHDNSYLQASFNKYGRDVFTFEIIFKLHKYLRPCLETIEQRFINELNPEYNLQKIVGKYNGYVCTEEVKEALRIANRGKECKPETRALLSAKMKLVIQSKNWIEVLSSINSKHWIVTRPDGTKEEIFNLNKYCRENNLNGGVMVAVSKGKRKHHKGYRVEAVIPDQNSSFQSGRYKSSSLSTDGNS